MTLRDDEWLSWLRTPQASFAQAWLSRTAGRQLGVVGRLLVGSTFRRADAVTVEAKANAPSRRPDAVVIPPGVDIDHFTPRAQNTPVSGRVIAVGNLLGRKGYDLLIRAIARVVQHNKAVHLLLVGCGPEEISLRLLTHQLGIDSAVRFVGSVSRTQLPAYLRSAEVFCHPARWDTFPLAPLEAMACGLPTTVSAAGGLPDIVGKAGVVHQIGDDMELSTILINLLSNPSLRESLGKAARARILERFTWQAMCDSYIELYESLAEERRARSTRR